MRVARFRLRVESEIPMKFFAKDSRDVPTRPNAPNDMRQMRFKHRIDSRLFRDYNKTHFLLVALDKVLMAAKWPGAMRWHPLLKPKNNHWFNLPTNVEVRELVEGECEVGKPGRTTETAPRTVKTIDMGVNIQVGQSPLTVAVCDILIDQAEYIYIKDTCPCRHGRDCKNHRHDLGCMFLGASGVDVAPDISHLATKEEAKAHIRAGVADGLMPMAGRFRVDNYAFMLPDHSTLVGICLCCDCCCFMQSYRNTPSDILDEICYKLPGTRLVADSSKCIGCGTCAKHCYLKAINIEGGVSVTSDICRACGRCVTRCKQHARSLVTSDPEYALKAANEILGRANLKAAPDEAAKPAVRDITAPRGEYARWKSID